MKITKNLIIFLLTSVFTYGYCQKVEKPETLNKKFTNGGENRELLDKADIAFNSGDFLAAIPFYQELEKTYPDELYLKFKIGICYLNKKLEHNLALPFLEKVYQTKPKLVNISLYLGQAYFYNYQFKEALEQYNLFLSRNTNPEQIPIIQHYIDNCNNAIEFTANPVEVEIKNIGTTINTGAQEYAPVISSDESVLMYTYRGLKSTGGLQNKKNKPDPQGEYYEDIFVSTKDLENWQEPVSVGTDINGNGHDACIALSNDGQKLFIYKFTDKDLGDIYVSQLKGTLWSAPKRLKGKINTKFWEGSASLSSDGKTLYFSSSNPGGYGGKDIYRARLQKDGSWGNIQNLGDEINTPYDDDGTFILPDGKILLFSSKGHNSMGGYDIFRADLKSDSIWSSPVNMGYPINTIEDELYYVLSASGQRGYYSSGKPGGSGGQDIYVVEPGLAGKRALILVKGIISKYGKPIESDITVEFSDPDNTREYTTQSEFNSNSATGKYLINFPAGNSYKVTYHLNGFKDKIEVIDATGIKDFEVRIIPVEFSTQDEKEGKIKDIASTDSPTGTNPNSENKKALLSLRDSIRASQKAIARAKSDSIMAQKKQIQLAKEEAIRAKKQHEREIDSLENSEKREFAKKYGFQPIYFDLAKSDIRADAEIGLDKIVQVMKEYPNLVVELKSYTDCRSNEKSNMALSKRRVKSSLAYLQNKGISSERVYGKGYGETKLLNVCSCENERITPCSEEEHQANRRTEFYIVKIK